MSQRNIDRRAIFFWFSALLVFALIPIAPDEFLWVSEVLGAALVVLGIASYADDVSRRNGGGHKG
jgi:hypothetical protein